MAGNGFIHGCRLAIHGPSRPDSSEERWLTTRLDAWVLCREGEYEEIPTPSTSSLARALGRGETGGLRHFAREALNLGRMSRISDQELFKLVGRALDCGRLVVVARAAGAGTAPSAGSALGKFFARVARLALDKITCNGSHYRLVLWHKVNRRDVGRTFRVIPLNEAAAILDRRAAQAPQQ